MSDSTVKSVASPRSTRAAALERRRALSLSGAAALTGIKSSAASPVARTAGSGKTRSRARRDVLSQDGSKLSTANADVPVDALLTSDVGLVNPGAFVHLESSTPSQDCGCDDPDGNDATNQTLESLVLSGKKDDPTAATMFATASVRQLGRERRNALSRQGKVAIGASANARSTRSSIYKPLSDVLTGLSGREAARVHREVLCRQGRGNDVACRPSGRIRQKPVVPAKVEQGTTLSGTPVTGTQVEHSVMVTGTDSGSCRIITGTEYIGSEQYESLCTSIPEPGPAKVGLGRTALGQVVSGTEVSGSVKITGDEHGFCKTVTGTEYLSAEKFESFCATKAFQPPAKVRVTTTEAGQRLSGSDVGRDVKVTGDEAGSDLRLTGSQYYEPESLNGVSRNGSGTPHKVSVMSTLRKQELTGTDSAPGERVTGAERGACATVTGTETTGLEQYQACNRKPIPGPGKIDVMRTWNDQPISGTSVEYRSNVTGDEYGVCQPVTGTEYVGPDKLPEVCAPDLQVASRVLMSSRSGVHDTVTTGTSLGPDKKVTGSSRGEGMVLSGTPYAGVSQRPLSTGPMASSRFLNVNDSPTSTAEVFSESTVGSGDFSVTSPAREARDSSISRVTGTGYGATGRRITGPVNLAAGLVSGTPEFRYRDDAYSAAPSDVVSDVARSRLTGDGREGGFAITGAAWGRSGSITGTEGVSTRRNPTLRGGQRSPESGAQALKDRQRPEAPVIQVTGSSGSDAKGPSVTYSGGTRG